jgi:pilus assembly protein CpaC
MGFDSLARQARRAIFIAVCVLAPAVIAPEQAHAASPVLPEQVGMYAGQASVYSVPGALKRIAVGNGNLIEVKVVGKNELVIIANKPGDTNVQLWFANGQQRMVSLHIGEGNGEQMADVVKRMLGDIQGVEVTPVGSNVVVTGSNIGSGESSRIDAIKKIYPQVMNFTSTSAVEMQPMVMMQVRIMEFDKKAMNQIGIQWDTQIQGPVGGLLHDFQTNPYFRVIPPDPGLANLANFPTRVPGTQSYLGIATTIGSKINLAMQTGSAWELATPQLSARSGGSADFLVGGQVPLPVSSGFGETTVEYKDYGIKLHLEPVVSAEGDISAKIETELSKIDPTVVVAGYPGFITRRSNAEVNVHEGDTIVISGLVDANATKEMDKMPGLGQIPIIGELFRSRSFQANRTDLVVFITPYIIGAKTKENLDLIEHSKQMESDFRKNVGKDIVD